jgi:hypothetical protein
MCCDKPLIVAVWIAGKYVNQCQNCQKVVG